MPKEIFCCRYCGRDTTSKTQVCVTCRGENRGGNEEMRGRHVINGNFEGSPLDEADRDDNYHGTTFRDDI